MRSAAAVLRNAGVVEARRDGAWVYYRLARQDDPQRKRLLRSLVDTFPDRDVLERDVARLLRERGPAACG